MNKIADLLKYPQVRMDFVRRTRLGPFWNNTLLTGQYWRLYHNDSSGAGLLWNGKRMELKPDRLYLLQPLCGIQTWCHSEPVQLYLHFEITQIIGNYDSPVTVIPLKEPFSMLLDQLYAEIEKDPWTKSNRTKMIAAALASLAVAELPEKSYVRFDPDSRIETVCDHIRINLSEALNVDELARMAHMSVNSFLRHFKENTGVTPHQYLLNLRYTRAARMLETTDIPIDEICDVIGVNDRFHFSRTFKTIYGIAPGQYRANREKL